MNGCVVMCVLTKANKSGGVQNVTLFSDKVKFDTLNILNSKGTVFLGYFNLASIHLIETLKLFCSEGENDG